METYKFCFIDGYSLRYEEYSTKVFCLSEAMDKFNDAFGEDFDHQMIYIYRNSDCIYDRDNAD